MRCPPMQPAWPGSQDSAPDPRHRALCERFRVNSSLVGHPMAVFGNSTGRRCDFDWCTTSQAESRREARRALPRKQPMGGPPMAVFGNGTGRRCDVDSCTMSGAARIEARGSARARQADTGPFALKRPRSGLRGRGAVRCPAIHATPVPSEDSAPCPCLSALAERVQRERLIGPRLPALCVTVPLC